MLINKILSQRSWFRVKDSITHPNKIYLSVCLSVCLSVYLSIYPSIHASIHPFIYLWLYSPLLNLGPYFSFLIFLHCRQDSLGGDQPSQGRYLHTGQHKQNEGTQTSTPQMGFEPTIPVFERAKTIHAVDLAAVVIGPYKITHKIVVLINFKRVKR
jgi:hypothetical protein